MQPQLSERFLLRELDDGCVVFDRRYGNTHALNSLTSAMFKALLAAPGEAPHQVLAHLSADGVGADAQWRETVDQALAQLADHQLTVRD